MALVIYQDVCVEHKPEPYPDDPTQLCDPPHVDFVGGIAIMMIVVLVGSLNDWQKERQFRALHEKEDRTIKVIRDGREQQVSIKVSSNLHRSYDPVAKIFAGRSCRRHRPFGTW